MQLAVGMGALHDNWLAFERDEGRRTRAEKLDEGLAVYDGLMRGQPFTYTGRHYQVRPTDLMNPPPPCRPRVPVWVVGAHPARRSLARAARWDGLLATKVGFSETTPFGPSDLADVVAAVRPLREEAGLPWVGYDVVAEASAHPGRRGCRGRRVGRGRGDLVGGIGLGDGWRRRRAASGPDRRRATAGLTGPRAAPHPGGSRTLRPAHPRCVTANFPDAATTSSSRSVATPSCPGISDGTDSRCVERRQSIEKCDRAALFAATDLMGRVVHNPFPAIHGFHIFWIASDRPAPRRRKGAVPWEPSSACSPAAGCCWSGPA